MLKIHQHFLLVSLAIAAGILAVATVIGYLTFKSIIIRDYNERLRHQIDLLEVTMPEAINLDDFARRVHEATGLRMTVVDRNGSVLGESDYDRSEMEEHSGRPEIMQAARELYGSEIRYSDTLRHDLLYVAKRMEYRGRIVTLRLAIGLTDMLLRYWHIFVNVLLVFIAFILFSFLLAQRMSKRLRYDVAQISDYLEEIANKNYRAVVKPRYYAEFLQIGLLSKNLVKKLQRREKQRRKYTAKLRLINQQRSDILSAISHEFKNPIAAIVGYTETLRDDQDIDPKIRQRFLEKVLSNANKITTMLDRLSFSVKLENNDLELRPEMLDLHQLCEEVTATLSKKYPEREIVCDVDPLPLYADHTLLEIALTNLVDNALKYSDEKVEIVLSEGRLGVRDNGMGIDAKELENITSKYYRVTKNTWDNSMGLGLSIVTYILKLHGTELAIESTPGVGSVFSFDTTPMCRGQLPEPGHSSPETER